MKAALYRETGPAGAVLSVEEVETPEPGPGQVRVRISCSGVNPTDWKSRAGLTAGPPEGLQIPHQDGAGVIDALGEGVEVHLFFTFWGFDMITKKTMAHLKFTPLGNTATHMPQGLGGIPGMTAMATTMLKKGPTALCVG